MSVGWRRCPENCNGDGTVQCCHQPAGNGGGASGDGAVAGASFAPRGPTEDREFCHLRRLVEHPLYNTTLYHALQGRTLLVMRRLDHYAIYLLTAGTYTRFSLGWTLFILEWALVKVGIAVELRPVGTRRILTVAIYVIMGLSITKLRNIEPLTLRMSRSQRSP